MDEEVSGKEKEEEGKEKKKESWGGGRLKKSEERRGKNREKDFERLRLGKRGKEEKGIEEEI